ncbi:MAG: hypothetical protein K2Y27_26395 [Xanthobacteraceae bacterium]|nr:hypothetical protein [Xanthobacteraceae bacterium]
MTFTFFGKRDDAACDDLSNEGWISRLRAHRAGAIKGIAHDRKGVRSERRISDEWLYCR